MREGGYNPYGLKIPRLGKNKIPWLWRPQDCPDGADFGEAFIFNEFNSRLHTMETMCNRHHETEESPATLFLEYAAQ